MDHAQTTRFAGVDPTADADFPDWYQGGTADSPSTTFAEALRDLPRATGTPVAYRNPHSDEWVETDRFNAIVEHTRLRTDDTDPLFHIPTNSYMILNPLDVYGPLEELLRDKTYEGEVLGDITFGEIRQYRGGGEVHMDVMFDGLEVALPGRSDPITMGLTSGYDFFGGHAVYVEGFAQDGACRNTMRQLTDKEIVKHVGDVADFESWWEDILAQIEVVTDDLAGFIRDAQDLEIDFTEVPFSVTEFYGLCGFPEYLAEHASSDAEANAQDPFSIDMWTLHSGATYALTHFFKGKEGAALDRYVRIANDILFNPTGTIERVEREYHDRSASENNSQEVLDDGGIVSVQEVGSNLRTKATQFEEREAAIRERFQTVSE